MLPTRYKIYAWYQQVVNFIIPAGHDHFGH